MFWLAWAALSEEELSRAIYKVYNTETKFIFFPYFLLKHKREQ